MSVQKDSSSVTVTSMEFIKPLTTCVAKGDLEGINLHLTHDTDLDAGNWVGATPLMLAVQYNRIKIARDLLEAGASIRATDNNKYTALNWCARKNQNGFALELITAGADINHQDENTRYSPLMWGAIKGYLGIVVTFIKAGANLDLQDRTGTTAIMHAASEGHFDIVKTLKNAGADLHIKNKILKNVYDCAHTKEMIAYLKQFMTPTEHPVSTLYYF